MNDNADFSPLIRMLKERHIAYRLIRVRAIGPFMLATGIAESPMTIVTNSSGNDSVVELVHSGVFDEGTLKALLEVIERGPGQTGVHFLSRGVSQPINPSPH